MSAANVIAATLNLMSALIVLISVLRQIRYGNVGTCAFAFWASSGCFIAGINAIIWHDGIHDIIPVWCDVCQFSGGIRWVHIY